MTEHRCHPVAILAVRTVHTAVFGAELASIGWLIVSGLRRRQDRTVALAAVAVAAETAVFLANDGVCPLTPLTERLGAANGSVSDIFLLDAIARTIPIWSSLLVALGILLHVRAAVRRDDRTAEGARSIVLDRSGAPSGEGPVS
jgi:hypothetical protein